MPEASRSTMLPSRTMMVRPKLGALVESSGPPNHWLGSGVPWSRGGDRGVAHNRVDRMVVRQWLVERDAGAERLDGLIARMGKGRRRLKADPRSPIAKREVGRMAELERCGQVEASSRSDHILVGDAPRPVPA